MLLANLLERLLDRASQHTRNLGLIASTREAACGLLTRSLYTPRSGDSVSARRRRHRGGSNGMAVGRPTASRLARVGEGATARNVLTLLFPDDIALWSDIARHSDGPRRTIRPRRPFLIVKPKVSGIVSNMPLVWFAIVTLARGVVA